MCGNGVVAFVAFAIHNIACPHYVPTAHHALVVIVRVMVRQSRGVWVAGGSNKTPLLHPLRVVFPELEDGEGATLKNWMEGNISPMFTYSAFILP